MNNVNEPVLCNWFHFKWFSGSIGKQMGRNYADSKKAHRKVTINTGKNKHCSSKTVLILQYLTQYYYHCNILLWINICCFGVMNSLQIVITANIIYFKLYNGDIDMTSIVRKNEQQSY